MEPEILYEMLKKTQEPKGYYFDNDKEVVLDLLQSLSFNKERYGYMSCPCRLASGNRKNDEDILCPCVYRVKDVKQYGSCYCGLYVSKEWNDGSIEHEHVPERRPVSRMIL